MAEPVVRVTLFVPGAPTMRGVKIDEEAHAEWVENDGEFGKAFSFGTVASDMVARIDAAPGALVIQWSIDLNGGRERIVRAVKRLREVGALAVRLEQSKLGWDAARWIELFSVDDARSWHRGAVIFLHANAAMQSCGMHAFSLPDVRAEMAGGDPSVMQELASLLNVYQLAEDPMIRSGQTFSPDPSTPRRVLERWPDTEYPPDHPCHNPYGVWRLGPPGGTAREMGELVPIFVPTLAALLLAMEDRAGRPLTKNEVETARDKGACIMMKPRDMQLLERARGYADLDPELAWEQWQALRAARA